ncbi:MAG TPA: DUF4332 domain-containing protein [Gammaproteobacteria bacterium]|nr:DUF4332 domain-containing protein [Gammaproteobacteria bacterium]
MGMLVLGILLGWAVEWLFVTFYLHPKQSADHTDSEVMNRRLSGCEEKLAHRDHQIAELKEEIARLQVPEASKPEAKTERVDEAAEDGSVTVKPLIDLKAVSGIGPKIAELLTQAGIGDCKTLSQSTSATLKEILTAAGPNYAMADVTTWVEQARLLTQGDQAGLEKLQSSLKT